MKNSFRKKISFTRFNLFIRTFVRKHARKKYIYIKRFSTIFFNSTILGRCISFSGLFRWSNIFLLINNNCTQTVLLYVEDDFFSISFMFFQVCLLTWNFFWNLKLVEISEMFNNKKHLWHFSLITWPKVL